jgi:hypothetical protein
MQVVENGVVTTGPDNHGVDSHSRGIRTKTVAYSTSIQEPSAMPQNRDHIMLEI